MKFYPVILVCGMLSACVGNSVENAPVQTFDHNSDVEVMILGTLHFTGGGNDVVNPEVDDFLSPARQIEIKDVLDRLEAYAPDKIMLELDTEREEEFNVGYRAYLDGKHKLNVNERQQLGMRLAARLGHDRLYGVDFSNFLDYRGALAAAEELGQDHLTDALQASIDEVTAEADSQKKMPLGERLIRLNSNFGTDQDYYLTIAQMGSIDNPQGALQILTWWERNLVMFARTANYAEPGDKVLFIVGAGHLYLLNQFFEDARGFTVINPVPYLEEQR